MIYNCWLAGAPENFIAFQLPSLVAGEKGVKATDIEALKHVSKPWFLTGQAPVPTQGVKGVQQNRLSTKEREGFDRPAITRPSRPSPLLNSHVQAIDLVRRRFFNQQDNSVMSLITNVLELEIAQRLHFVQPPGRECRGKNEASPAAGRGPDRQSRSRSC